jgi:hypothetical protein
MTKSDESWLYSPGETQTCTNAFYQFISEYDKIISLFMFVVLSASRLDEMQAIASQALAGPEEREKPPESFNKKTAVNKVREFSAQLSRMLVTSMVDNFHCYLSDLLQEVMVKKHEVLRSSDRVTTQEILQFDKMKDLRSFLADRKLNELSYGGLSVMQEFISDRLGIAIFNSEKERLLLTIFLELRNIHVHNRGVINRLFLNRVGTSTVSDFSFRLGEKYYVDMDEFVVLSKNSIHVAKNLDEGMAKKFKLNRSHYKTRLAKERSAKK